MFDHIVEIIALVLFAVNTLYVVALAATIGRIAALLNAPAPKEGPQ